MSSGTITKNLWTAVKELLLFYSYVSICIYTYVFFPIGAFSGNIILALFLSVFLAISVGSLYRPLTGRITSDYTTLMLVVGFLLAPLSAGFIGLWALPPVGVLYLLITAIRVFYLSSTKED